MTTQASGFRARWIRAPLLSPRWLLARAALILLCLAVAHLLGWRANVSFLSGTPSDGVQIRLLPLLCGLTYAMAYFATVVLVPILAIAAALLAVMTGLARKAPAD